MRLRSRVEVGDVVKASMHLGSAFLEDLGVQIHKVVVKELEMAFVAVERCGFAEVRAPLHSKFKS